MPTPSSIKSRCRRLASVGIQMAAKLTAAAVEVNVVDPFARKGYRFKGTSEVIVGGELFQQIMNFYRGRWVDAGRSKSEARIRSFVLVKVESALPLISPAYDDTSVDEQSIRKHWISYFAALNKG